LLTAINKKREINIIELPLNASGPKRVLNSICSLLKIILMVIKILVGAYQKIGLTISINKIDLTQFKGRDIIEDGSKTENRLVIIIFS
jgi:hypothetical protein